MRQFSFYFMMVIVFGIIGWLLECIHCTGLKHKFTNRGYLIGPYCPIYGFGTLFAYLVLYRFKYNMFLLFILSVLLTFLLEYITSYVMEKIFSIRWWDYSNEKFNINGRICLKNGILFGIMSLVFIYCLIPIYIDMTNLISLNVLNMISVIILFIFLLDNIISFCLINKIKDKYKFINRDATDEVKKVLFRRIKINSR